MLKQEFGGTENMAVDVTSTPLITTFGCAGKSLLSAEVVNTGAAALVAFKIQRKLHESAEWEDFFGGTDFASATNGAIKFVSTVKPHTLAAGATSTFSIWIEGAVATRLCATSDVGGTTVTIKGNVQEV